MVNKMPFKPTFILSLAASVNFSVAMKSAPQQHRILQQSRPYCGFRNRHDNPWHEPVDSCNDFALTREDCESTTYLVASSFCVWHSTEGACKAEDPHLDSVCAQRSTSAHACRQPLPSSRVSFNKCVWFEPDPNEITVVTYCGYPGESVAASNSRLCSQVAETKEQCEFTSYIQFQRCAWKQGKCQPPSIRYDERVCNQNFDESSCEAVTFLDQGLCQWYEFVMSPQPTPFPTTREPTFTEPSFSPSAVPSARPSRGRQVFTWRPTRPPTKYPTFSPTRPPTPSPTFVPTRNPTPGPTFPPSFHRSSAPTSVPSSMPSISASSAPSSAPSVLPTPVSSAYPSNAPSTQPTPGPTNRRPTGRPTRHPTPVSTTTRPTPAPTRFPTTLMPSDSPTHKPSFRPSFRATPFPSFATGEPTRRNDDSGSSEGNQQQSDGNGWRNTGGIVAAGVFGTLATWFAKKFGFCKQAGSDKDRQEQDAQGFDDANDFQQHANGLGGHFGSTWD